MKLKTLLYVLLLALMPAVFTACGDDDEPAYATDIYGTYSGSLEATVMNTLCNFDGNYTVEITMYYGINPAVTLPECSFAMPGTDTPLTIPSLTVRDINLSKEKSGYSISSGERKIEVDGKEYPVSLSGTVIGKEVNLTYSVQPGRMPMPVNFNFKGKK